MQTPPAWKMLPGTATEINVAAGNGTGRIAIQSYPASAPCEAAYKGGEGTAYCVLHEREGFGVTLLAQDGLWNTHQEGLLRTAERYRRNGSDKPVFDLRPLARVKPDGTLIPRRDD